MEKFYTWKFNFYFLDQKLPFRYLSLGLQKRTPKLQEKPSALKREHPALQNMKILNFFLFSWVIFALLDPDPSAQINADPCGSGSETLLRTLTVQSYLVGENVDLEKLLQICDADDGFLLPGVDVTNHGIEA